MCLSATKCKTIPTTPTTTHPTLLHTISLTRAHSTSAACAAETQDNAEHSNAYTTEPPTGVTTAAGGRPSQPHPTQRRSAVPSYGLLGPAPPKASIRPHRPHSLTPAATAHHNTTVTSHSQQHSQMPPIPPIPADPLQAEAEAPTEAPTEQLHPQPPPHRHQTSPTEQTTTQQKVTPTKDSYTTSWPHRTTAYHRAGCKKLHKTDTLTKTQRRHCAIRLRHYTQGVAERHTRRSRPPWRRRQQQPLAWSKSSCSSAPKRPSARHLSRATPEPPQPNRSKATTSTSSNTWTPPLTPLQPPTTHSNPHSSPLSHSHTSNGNTYKQQPRQPSANTYPPPRPSQSTHGSHKQLGSSYNNDLQHASHRDTILRLSSTRTSESKHAKTKPNGRKTAWQKASHS